MAVSVVSMPTQASCVRTMGQARRDIARSSRRQGPRVGVANFLVSLGGVIVLSRLVGLVLGMAHKKSGPKVRLLSLFGLRWC